MGAADTGGAAAAGVEGPVELLRHALAGTLARRSGPLEMIRAAAEIAGCRVVLEERDGASLTAAPPAGRVGAIGGGGVTSPVAVGDGRTVRFERSGGSAPGDAELARALAELLIRHPEQREAGADENPGAARSGTAANRDLERAALVDVVLSATESDPDRSRALRALGLRSDRDVVVVAVSGPLGADLTAAMSLLLAGLDGPRPPVTLVGNVAAAVTQAPERATPWLRHSAPGSPIRTTRTCRSSRDSGSV